MYSYTMYGAAITPAVLAAFLWKRVTAAGGITSILLGGGGTLFWELVLQRPMGWNSILFSLPLSVGGLVLVSLATGRHRPEAGRPETDRRLPGGPEAGRPETDHHQTARRRAGDRPADLNSKE
jgi:Na+/proline symporter